MNFYGPHADVTQSNMYAITANHLTCVQFMPGGEYGYNCGDEVWKKLLLLNAFNIQPVMHATLTCMVCSDKQMVVGATLGYLHKLSEQVKFFLRCVYGNNIVLNIKLPIPVVVHAGAISAGVSGAIS